VPGTVFYAFLVLLAGATPVDSFVDARIAAAGVESALETDRTTLLRRVTFNLTGLPPAPADLDAFLADAEPGAYERVVERLLASPAYGERWGRHWLDLARYADTAGDSSDYPIPDAWRYRDWVIDAFNRDLPYDEFLRLQIAGDVIVPAGAPRERRVEGIVATGFVALSRRFGVGVLSDRHLIIDDTIDTLGRAVMGLTIACARCHDHKYDPVTTADYTALYGIFDSTRYPFPGSEERRHPEQLVPIAPPDVVAAADAAYAGAVAAKKAEREAAAARKAALEADLAAALTPATIATPTHASPLEIELPRAAEWEIDLGAGRVRGEIAVAIDGAPFAPLPGADAGPAPVWRRAGTRALGAGKHSVTIAAPPGSGHAITFVRATALPPSPEEVARRKAEIDAAAKALAAAGAAEKAAIADRPRYDTAYAVVEAEKPHDASIHVRGNPWQKGEVVPRGFPKAIAVSDPPVIASGSGRRELADWLTRPDHPYTARVFVSRAWERHFDRGLVPTSGDFGVRAARPTHPELLEFLARWFATDARWSVKALQKMIVLSEAYRRSARPTPSSLAKDPDNHLLARFPRQRLDAESIRDAILAASGALDPERGGRHPFPPVEKWRWTQHDPFRKTYASRKRSVYMMTPRIQRHPYLGLFDGADANACTEERGETTVPAQALFFMNNDLVHEASRAFAERLLGEAETDADRVVLAHRLALGREPRADEVYDAALFVRDYRQELERSGANEPETAAWAGFARTLLMCNEFVTID